MFYWGSGIVGTVRFLTVCFEIDLDVMTPLGPLTVLYPNFIVDRCCGTVEEGIKNGPIYAGEERKVLCERT